MGATTSCMVSCLWSPSALQVTQSTPWRPRNPDTVALCSVMRAWHPLATSPVKIPGCKDCANPEPKNLASCDILVDMIGEYDPQTPIWPSPEVIHRDHELPVPWEAVANPAEQCGFIYLHQHKLWAQMLSSSKEHRRVGPFSDKMKENFVEEVDALEGGTASMCADH